MTVKIYFARTTATFSLAASKKLSSDSLIIFIIIIYNIAKALLEIISIVSS